MTRTGPPGQRDALSRLLPCTLTVLMCAALAGAAQDAVVSGTVVDQRGDRLPRASVKLVGADGNAVAQTIADTRGEFQFTVQCARCRVEAYLPGFHANAADVSAGQPVRVELRIAPIEETVVVSATRGEAPTSQVGAAVTIVDAQEIERRGTPLVAELLRSTPGVAVTRVGGYGNVTSMFVRGGESSYNKVLLDGIPLNEPGGVFNFSNVTSEHLERIELVRGAQSALFGSDAMSSVVQLVTKRAAKGDPHVEGSAEIGSNAWGRGSVSLGGASEKIDGTIHVARLQTDNEVPNNEFENTTVAANGGVTVSPDLSLRFVGRFERGRTGAPGATAFGRPDMDAFFHRNDGVGGVTMNHRLAAAWQHRLAYAVSTSYQESTNLVVDPPYVPRFGDRVAPFSFSDFPYDSTTDLTRHHLSYVGDSRTPAALGVDHLLTVAFDWDGERGVLGNRMAGTAVEASRDNLGWTLQHQALGPNVALTTGVRIERNDSFGTDVVPRVSLAWMVSEGTGSAGSTKIKANAGWGVKEPTLIQSFSPSPSFLGNPNLLPERARSFDGGVEQRLLGDRVKVDLAAFYSRYDNIISTRTTSFSPFMAQYFNIGLTRAKGTELVVDVAPAPGLRAAFGHTFMKSEIVRSTSPASVVFQVGNDLFRRPSHSGFVDVSYSRGIASADLHGTIVGRRVDSDFSSLVPPIGGIL